MDSQMARRDHAKKLPTQVWESHYGSDKKLLWEGGMGIRTEGNNYVAELAAAAILLSSVPYQVHLTLFSDCLSAINTLGLPPLSERKRLRTPARIWAAMGQDARQKRPDLVIQHVKSHQGIATFEQIGNDRADQMAKHYLGLTEHDTNPSLTTRSATQR